ncbi:hypothetical protein I553_8224 [Mycobacterium xenopi 4042]|uniref:Uncharacterized protein n=1 Tax=Mycobacterium xenopi 4042 TaxID=1299334 RepID=X8BLG3_MYCXE|nr:hypothetical protein I552_7890 [Mycobacterium xenopi 3993]EUA43890.1 hypothetical protein I553_8224 [Mycobacterium xenopi 4042]
MTFSPSLPGGHLMHGFSGKGPHRLAARYCGVLAVVDAALRH